MPLYVTLLSSWLFPLLVSGTFHFIKCHTGCFIHWIPMKHWHGQWTRLWTVLENGIIKCTKYSIWSVGTK
jgi:hypothetical protein